MSFFPSMSTNYYRSLVNKKHPFLTCIVKVDTQSQWQKTVNRVLRRIHGIYSFRMNDNGVVRISGTVDPYLLLEVLRKAGRSAEMRLFQFGECSSNLSVQDTPQDGRYLHAADLSRPRPPSHRAIDNQSNGYDGHYYSSYGNNHDYYHDYHQHYGYRDADSQHRLEYELKYGHGGYEHEYGHGGNQHRLEYEHEYGRGGNQIRSHYSATQSRSGEGMSCCRVM